MFGEIAGKNLKKAIEIKCLVLFIQCFVMPRFHEDEETSRETWLVETTKNRPSSSNNSV